MLSCSPRRFRNDIEQARFQQLIRDKQSDGQPVTSITSQLVLCLLFFASFLAGASLTVQMFCRLDALGVPCRVADRWLDCRAFGRPHATSSAPVRQAGTSPANLT